MHYPREGLSTRLRLTIAVLSLGSLLSFSLGQALGHLPASSGTTAHITPPQRPAASASGSLATAKLVATRARSIPTSAATRHVTTEAKGGHKRDRGHAGKHSKSRELSGPPKGGTNGSTATSSGGDASTD